MDRNKITAFLDSYLDIGGMEDLSLNGLQVEGSPEVLKIALSPDASLESLETAAKSGCELLIVHHGIFWGNQFRITGFHAERFRCMFHSGMNLYAAHLPLDYHPEVGNNSILCKLLGLKDVARSGPESGPWWFGGELLSKLSWEEFVDLARKRISKEVMLFPFGAEAVSRVAVCSGSGASLIPDVKEAGFDAFLTGESTHISFHIARELKLNVFFGGHYATETVGLKALEEKLKDKFDIQTVFLDIPTGL